MGVPIGAADYFVQAVKAATGETMIVYSIEWKYSGRKFRKFFETEREAHDWVNAVTIHTTGEFTGPLKHEIVGAPGLISFLETYGR